MGSNGNKIVSEATASIFSPVKCETPGQSSCGDFAFFDGFDTTEAQGPDLWNGVWTAELSVAPIPPATLPNKCTIDFAYNHYSSTTVNGAFFDIFAGDQKIEFNVSSSGSCTGSILPGGPNNPVHPKPSTPLRANFAPGTPSLIRGFVGDSLKVTASPQGGLGIGRRFAWKSFPYNQGIGTTVDFSGVDFGGRQDTTFVFLQTGAYAVRYLLRDGNDINGQGGHYALSGVCTFDITARPALAARAVSHSLPGTATTYTWYATSVTLKNVGTETWTGTAFTLGQMAYQYWSPSGMGMGTGSVATHKTKTFSYNIGMMGPYTGWQNNYWKMRKSGVAFGDSIGTRSYVKAGSGPPPPEARLELDWGGLLAWIGPRAAYAALPADRVLQGDVLQVVEARDFPLPVEEIAATGEFRLRYEAALAEPWDVDFVFVVEYDPAVFEPGKVQRGTRGGTHTIQLEADLPGRLVVTGKRIGGSKLEGEGLIFDVPLVLKPGAAVPATFPLVSLTALQ